MVLPFVGRRSELSRLLQALTTRRGSGVVVVGREGMGKTRLLQEARVQARARGATVHWVTATQATASVPFGAFAHLLPADAATGEPARLVNHALGHLRDGGAAIVADDVPLLDTGSAALLQHLLMTDGMRVVAAARTGDRDEDPTPWWSRLPVEHLELAPLDADEIAEALTGSLSGLVDSGLRARLAQLSGGNPFLLGELVDASLQAGSIRCRGGVWQATGPLLESATLPTVVAARLDRLSAEARAAAELVALAEPVGAELLEALLAPELIGALEQEHLLDTQEDGRRRPIRLAHPLYAESLRATVPPLRARDHHRRLADALARTGLRRRRDHVRLAVWRLQAGQREHPQLFLDASREAARAFDHDLAGRLAQAAVDAGGGFAAEVALLAELRYQGRAAEAAERAAELARRAPDEPGRASIARVQVNCHLALGEVAKAQDVLDGALATTVDQALRHRLLAHRADVAFATGDLSRAIHLADELVAGQPEAGVVVRLTPTGVRALACAGRAFDALDLADRTLGVLERDSSPDVAVQDSIRMVRMQALAYVGRVGEALNLSRAGHLTSRNRVIARTRPLWAHDLGQSAVLAGRAASARSWLQETYAGLPEGVTDAVRAWMLDGLAEASALLGEPDEARSWVTRLHDELADEVVTLRRSGRVWAVAAGGELTRACELAVEHAENLREVGALMMQAFVLHDAARLGAAADVAGELQAAAGACQGELAPLLAQHACALGSEDGDALDAVADALGTRGYALWAAEASAAAARAHRSSGRSGSAMTAAERARHYVTRCENARTPLLDRLDDQRSPLTTREREVAGLAARGLSDRDIATRLQVSLRTVHSHLYRAYRKLNVDGRDQLAAILGPFDGSSAGDARPDRRRSRMRRQPDAL
jgi:DNA-binding CsgD family transcriptional regulator/tetratricopeptide (TPR) repeat protein